MLEVAAEPTRRRLLQLLASGERTVTQLAAEFPVTRSAISQHLAVLAEVGLVTARKQGRERHYRLAETGVRQLRTLFETFWSDELARLVADAAISSSPAASHEEKRTVPFTPFTLCAPFTKSVIVPLEPADTFALITEPDRLRRWVAIAARVELRAGGEFRWTVTPGHSAAGTFVEVDPDRRVVFTWGWEHGGDPLPGGSTVSVTLTPVEGGTEVRLVHDGLTDEQSERHAEGWSHFLDRLVEAGRRGDAGPDEWAAAPDQIDELSSAEATLAILQHVLRNVEAADLARQTPCSEFDVAQLADHLMGSIAAIGVAAGAQMPPCDSNAPLEVQVADAAQVALEAWRRRGTDGSVPRGSSEMPAAVMAGVMSIEFLVHAWDFAKATGREVVVSDSVCDYVYGLARQIITPQARGFAGFSDPVETGSDAGVFDRLIAFTGRDPVGSGTTAN